MRCSCDKELFEVRLEPPCRRPIFNERTEGRGEGFLNKEITKTSKRGAGSLPGPQLFLFEISAVLWWKTSSPLYARRYTDALSVDDYFERLVLCGTSESLISIENLSKLEMMCNQPAGFYLPCSDRLEQHGRCHSVNESCP
jgi:hypothetical protein